MDESATCTCKISRVREAYDLEMADETLVRNWQDGTSVRSLARSFNEDIIAARHNDVDGSSISWNRLPIYEAIKTDDLTDAETIEVRRQLERAGIDPDELESDTISHQTMYRHLTSCLDAKASADPTPDERREKARDTVYALQRRTALVTESTIETLQSAGVTDIGDPDVIIDVQVSCRQCGRLLDFETALTEGCDCS